MGIIELASAVLLLIPALAAYGAIMLAVVMIGAIYTHAMHHESIRLPFNFFLLGLSLIVAFARQQVIFKKNVP